MRLKLKKKIKIKVKSSIKWLASLIIDYVLWVIMIFTISIALCAFVFHHFIGKTDEAIFYLGIFFFVYYFSNIIMETFQSSKETRKLKKEIKLMNDQIQMLKQEEEVIPLNDCIHYNPLDN